MSNKKAQACEEGLDGVKIKNHSIIKSCLKHKRQRCIAYRRAFLKILKKENYKVFQKKIDFLLSKK